MILANKKLNTRGKDVDWIKVDYYYCKTLSQIRETLRSLKNAEIIHNFTCKATNFAFEILDSRAPQNSGETVSITIIEPWADLYRGRKKLAVTRNLHFCNGNSGSSDGRNSLNTCNLEILFNSNQCS